MKCRRCRQPGSPVNNLLVRLDRLSSVTLLSACSGYDYEDHHNLPERPFILFSVKDLRTLESLWKKVFSHLTVPAYLTYNGASQFLFEIELPLDWPKRNDVLTELWSKIDSRMKEYQ